MEGSENLVERFRGEARSPYREWVAQEGIPVYDAHYVQDLRAVELAPWPRRGGLGAYLLHDASDRTNDSYLAEIPPGGSLKPQRQLFDEMIYVLSGRGATRVWHRAGQEASFEWKAGSLLAIPLNAWHQHFNGSGTEPVRFLGVTNAPAIFDLFDDAEFVFHCPYEFSGRFSGEPDYFTRPGRLEGYMLHTNFVADVRSLELMDAAARGGKGRHLRFVLANGRMLSHVSEFPVGTYKMAHRHGPGAYVVVLGGQGYTLMWPEGGEIKRYDWQEGSLVIPPNLWFHQHFNTGPAPARYLALKCRDTVIYDARGVPKAWLSVREGGDQIDYVDEDPRIRQWYQEELRKNGVPFRMGEVLADSARAAG